MNRAPYFAVGLTVILALASGVFLAAKDSLAFDAREAMLFEPAAHQDALQGAAQRSGEKTAAALVDFSQSPRTAKTSKSSNNTVGLRYLGPNGRSI